MSRLSKTSERSDKTCGDREAWYVITGPPCSGKSTTIDLLQGRGNRVRPEIARQYVEEEVARGWTVAELRSNPQRFQLEVLRRAVASEAVAPKHESMFFDRGVPDSLSYFRFYGIAASSYYHLISAPPKYGKVFILEFIPEYHVDGIRTENLDDCNLLSDLLRDVYAELAVDVQYVPFLAPDERVDFILRRVGVSRGGRNL